MTALFLAFTLASSHPAFALRPRSAGLEEPTAITHQIESLLADSPPALVTATGMEEELNYLFVMLPREWVCGLEGNFIAVNGKCRYFRSREWGFYEVITPPSGLSFAKLVELDGPLLPVLRRLTDNVDSLAKRHPSPEQADIVLPGVVMSQYPQIEVRLEYWPKHVRISVNGSPVYLLSREDVIRVARYSMRDDGLSQTDRRAVAYSLAAAGLLFDRGLNQAVVRRGLESTELFRALPSELRAGVEAELKLHGKRWAVSRPYDAEFAAALKPMLERGEITHIVIDGTPLQWNKEDSVKETLFTLWDALAQAGLTKGMAVDCQREGEYLRFFVFNSSYQSEINTDESNALVERAAAAGVILDRVKQAILYSRREDRPSTWALIENTLKEASLKNHLRLFRLTPDKILELADREEGLILLAPSLFYALSGHYEDNRPFSDDEALKTLLMMEGEFNEALAAGIPIESPSWVALGRSKALGFIRRARILIESLAAGVESIQIRWASQVPNLLRPALLEVLEEGSRSGTRFLLGVADAPSIQPGDPVRISLSVEAVRKESALRRDGKLSPGEEGPAMQELRRLLSQLSSSLPEPARLPVDYGVGVVEVGSWQAVPAPIAPAPQPSQSAPQPSRPAPAPVGEKVSLWIGSDGSVRLDRESQMPPLARPSGRNVDLEPPGPPEETKVFMLSVPVTVERDGPWERIPYLQDFAATWFRKGRFRQNMPNWTGLQWMDQAIVDFDYTRRVVRDVYDRLMAYTFPIAMEMRSVLPEVRAQEEEFFRYFSDLWMKTEETRHARAFAWACLFHGANLRGHPQVRLLMAEALTKPGSPLDLSHWGRVKQKAFSLRDLQSRELYGVADTLVELEGQVGTVLEIMERLLDSGRDQWAYAVFLQYLVRMALWAAEGEGPGPEYVGVMPLLRDYMTQQNMPSEQAMLDFVKRMDPETGVATPGRRAYDLLRGFYEESFWTDAERLNLLIHARATASGGLSAGLESAEAIVRNLGGVYRPDEVTMEGENSYAVGKKELEISL